MNSELMVIKQLPIIEEKLKIVSNEIDEKVNHALSLICTEETVKQVKKTRAELNKEQALYEKARTAIKTAVLAPYTDFEKTYNMYVKDKYQQADVQLKTKINAVENSLKEEKAESIKTYFNEYLQSKNIDFIAFEQANINVTLTAGLKKLKEEAKTFIDKITDDLEYIGNHEHKDEVLMEYKKILNLSRACLTVENRHKAILAEQQRRAEIESRKAAEQEAVKRVEAALPPPLEAPTVAKPKENADPVRTLAFKVTAPLSKLKALKQFLDDGGYKYE